MTARRLQMAAMVAAGVFGALTAAAETRQERLARTVEALCATPHRLAGSAEGRAAGDHIIRRLREAGFTDADLLIQPFEMVQLRLDPGDCYFERDGHRVAIEPLRPNGLALPVTPPEGLTAETVYLGDAHWSRFDGLDVRGKIALIDYDCGERWTHAVHAGAVAVLFVTPPPAPADDPEADFPDTEGGSKAFYAHLDIPRFCVAQADARTHGLFEGARIRLFSRMAFQRTEGRNIMAFIPGAAGSPQDEFVVLAGRYDTFGVLPFATRAPDQAANVAGLIEAAIALRATPPARSVAVMFFDNEAQEQAGQLMFHFGRDGYTAEATHALPVLIADRQAERSFLEARLAAIATPEALIQKRSTRPAAEETRLAVLAEAERQYNRRVTALSDARREASALDREIARLKRQLARPLPEDEDRTPEDTQARYHQMRQDLAAAEAARLAAAPAAQAWVAAREHARDEIYRVRRQLTDGLLPGPDDAPGIHTLHADVIRAVQTRWQQRLDEQRREHAILEASLRLGERLAGRKLVAMVYWDMPAAPQRWAILGPPDRAGDAIPNPQATRWLTERHSAESAAGATDSVGFIAGVPSPQSLGASGLITFVLELASPGTAPRARAPTEPVPDIASFDRHLDGVIPFCQHLLERPELSRARIPPRLSAVLAFNVPRWSSSGRYDGSFVRAYDERFKAGDDVPNAILMARTRWPVLPLPPVDAWGGQLTFSTWAGTFQMLIRPHWELLIHAGLHDDQGRLTALSLYRPAGGLGNAGGWDQAGYYRATAKNQILVAEIKSRVLLSGIRTPVGTIREEAVQFLDAVTEAPPKQLNLTLGGDLMAVHAGRLSRYKVLQGSQLLLNNTSADASGAGYPPEPGFVDALERSARDTWILDENRLDHLRRRNVMENTLETLHARAEQFLDQAQDAADTPGLAWARRLASLGYTQRVYEPVRTVTNDLVKAIVILLLLAIPFSFALERAVIGTPNVYRQILGFALIFSAVFALLYLVHPAFRFVAFPGIVLLAFVIIIMSSAVIVIMWGKFEYEVRRLHGLAIASHQSTRTARGLVGAAVALGIATMRRRPLRSILTAVTILLLTFTILVFGAFKSDGGVRAIYVGPGPRDTLVEIGSVPGREIDPQTVAMLRRLFAAEAPSYIRGWSVAEGTEVLAGRLPDDTPFAASGQASLPPEDIALYPELRRALRGDVASFVADGGIFLPPEIFARVRATDGDGASARVQFAGRRYVLRGTFDPVALKAIRTLDGASFVPPNLAEVTRQLQQEFPNDPVAVQLRLEEMGLENFPPLDPETVVLVGNPRTAALPVPVRSVVFRPSSETDARRIASEAAVMLNQRISVALGGDHLRMLHAQHIAMGGIGKVAVPLVLGGLIIFGTMLSSVSDRQREIFTFSALGLGPRHVGALFFAEAGVYAVVGGMGGYLFAHVFSRVVEALARQGWVEAPMMNSSSMNAMLTLLVVMATVLASTFYPAYKASRAANPGAQRRWRMPEPVGDQMSMEFPFTVSDYDMIGLVSFLEEHLLAHREKSVGLFAADNVHVRHEESRFILTATLWLQPFDQGVSQSFTLWTRPSAIEGIDQVHVDMGRLSGSPAIWRRSARVFIHDLRNQFILWRTIPDEATEHYHQLTSARFGLAEADPATAPMEGSPA